MTGWILWRNVGLSASLKQTHDGVNIVCKKLGDFPTLFAAKTVSARGLAHQKLFMGRTRSADPPS